MNGGIWTFSFVFRLPFIFSSFLAFFSFLAPSACQVLIFSFLLPTSIVHSLWMRMWCPRVNLDFRVRKGEYRIWWQIIFVKSMISPLFLFLPDLSLSLFSHPSLYHVTSCLVLSSRPMVLVYINGKKNNSKDWLAFLFPLLQMVKNCHFRPPLYQILFFPFFFSYRSSERSLRCWTLLSFSCFFCSDSFLISVVFLHTYNGSLV